MDGHTSKIVKAARHYLGWTQEELARKGDVTPITIQNVESGKHTPNERTLKKIKSPMEEAGIIFTAYGFEFHPQKTVIVDDFMDVLKDASNVLKKGEEILFHCADERRNDQAVTAAFNEMREKGIRLRFTICEGNDYITGKPDDYRWIEAEYFAQSEVEVIYADKYIQHFADGEKDTFTVTKNAAKARSEKKQFEYWWNKGTEIAKK